MDSAQECLAVAGFGVAFGARMVLADLDFTLPRGSVTALLGPSGSGKSVLVRTLAVVAYQLARDERLGEAALPSLALVAVGLVPVILLSRTLRASRR